MTKAFFFNEENLLCERTCSPDYNPRCYSPYAVISYDTEPPTLVRSFGIGHIIRNASSHMPDFIIWHDGSIKQLDRFWGYKPSKF